MESGITKLGINSTYPLDRDLDVFFAFYYSEYHYIEWYDNVFIFCKNVINFY